jgi:hypothetical protein
MVARLSSGDTRSSSFLKSETRLQALIGNFRVVAGSFERNGVKQKAPKQSPSPSWGLHPRENTASQRYKE